jgi:pimeloyl-ACP methyl ester carboxylesterase
MAADAIGLMDALNIDRAHIVGASIGGTIAQIIASDYPQRTQSLVSIVSTTGASHLPRAQGDAQGGLLQVSDTVGEMQAQLEESGMFSSAIPRQVMAIVTVGDRSDKVSQISLPTVLLHGAQNNLMPKEHGQHTHALLEGSKFIVVEGMRHNPLLLI